jgi:hypothetical protein
MVMDRPNVNETELLGMLDSLRVDSQVGTRPGSTVTPPDGSTHASDASDVGEEIEHHDQQWIEWSEKHKSQQDRHKCRFFRSMHHDGAVVVA